MNNISVISSINIIVKNLLEILKQSTHIVYKSELDEGQRYGYNRLFKTGGFIVHLVLAADSASDEERGGNRGTLFEKIFSTFCGSIKEGLSLLEREAFINLPEQSNEVLASSSVKQLLRVKGVSGVDGEKGLVGDELDSIYENFKINYLFIYFVSVIDNTYF